MNRWRNYGLWTSIASLILLGLQATGVHIIPETYNDIVNQLLIVLVALGVISNPNDGKGYIDTSDKK